MRVSHVTCCKHTRNSGTWCIAFSYDVTHLVSLHPWLEDVRVRLMAYCKEETVNSHVISFLVSFAHSLHHVHTFHAVVAIQSHCIVFEQHLNLRMVHHSFLHNLRCSQERFSHHQIHLACQTCQIEGFLAGCITAAHYCHFLLSVEETVASCTCAHAHTCIFLFIFQSQILCSSTSRDDYRIGCNLLFSIYLESIWSLAQVSLCHDTVSDFSTEFLSLLSQVVHKHRTCHSFRITREVFHFSCSCQLSSRLESFIKYRIEVCSSCIYCGSISCRS